MRATTFGCLAAMLTPALASSAATYRVTLTGTSETINDGSGVFGTPGATLADSPFRQVFTIRTAGGNVADTPTLISYDSIFGTAPPYAVSGALTINGHTLTTAGLTYSSVSTDGVDYQITSNDQDGSGGNAKNYNFYLDLNGAGIPATVTQPLTLMLGGTSGTSAIDNFLVSVTDPSNVGLVSAAGSLNPTSISVASVPEPTAWLLMIVGFGTLGFAMRRTESSVSFKN